MAGCDARTLYSSASSSFLPWRTSVSTMFRRAPARQVVAGIGLGERAQLGHALVALPARDQGLAQRVARVGQQPVIGVLGHEAAEEPHRLLRPLELEEGAGQVEGRGRDVGVLGIAREDAPELGDGLLAPLELEIHPGEPVDRVGGAGRARAVGEDPVVDGPRLREALHAEERLPLPEAGLVGPAGRWREGLGLPECLQCRLVLPLGEAHLAEQKCGVGDAPVSRVALDQALEHAARHPVEAVLEGPVADGPQPLGLSDRERERRPGHQHAERRDKDA